MVFESEDGREVYRETTLKGQNLVLFDGLSDATTLQIGPESWLLRGFALEHETELLQALKRIIAEASLRQMITPGGQNMSVRTTSCGRLGWVSDRKGYRYEDRDPVSGRPWPAMPDVFSSLAATAADAAGFSDFEPDACLVNQYSPGAKMGLHQDKDERDFSQPIVSVSLGLPATFLFGGLRRSDKALRMELQHGDVVVWGGEDRLRYHGVLPIMAGRHPALGNQRINLTFRKAG
ncbi:MAG: DNA oxidative demethylase AlkB [Betaproteobacteria bacterium HGW-Betaproteobacteria-1]|jgi:alkylated DNA repair protein (DNA oxidative demethylase)|nr:MAG: DNA oxidative demethylase AlkB [Betaproteobacteria bacterium HGW-Betaproteobacteria-1]